MMYTLNTEYQIREQIWTSVARATAQLHFMAELPQILFLSADANAPLQTLQHF